MATSLRPNNISPNYRTLFWKSFYIGRRWSTVLPKTALPFAAREHVRLRTLHLVQELVKLKCYATDELLLKWLLVWRSCFLRDCDGAKCFENMVPVRCVESLNVYCLDLIFTCTITQTFQQGTNIFSSCLYEAWLDGNIYKLVIAFTVQKAVDIFYKIFEQIVVRKYFQVTICIWNTKVNTRQLK